jgi:AcrR family transcriptional regulator
MPRKKNFEHNDVIEKATALFWQHGYDNTSMSQLESAMGINKFSIYASFESKQGVFIQSLQCYRNKLSPMVIKLKSSEQGIHAIKQYFYDCLEMYRDTKGSKGCLMTNTRGQISREQHPAIFKEIDTFVDYQKKLFVEKLMSDGIDNETAIRKSNFLIIAKQALSIASKMHSDDEINDFIDMTFNAV